jgi:hypothetical protein
LSGLGLGFGHGNFGNREFGRGRVGNRFLISFSFGRFGLRNLGFDELGDGARRILGGNGFC